MVDALAFLQNIGFPELLVVLLIVLLLFGAKRLPEMASGLDDKDRKAAPLRRLPDPPLAARPERARDDRGPRDQGPRLARQWPVCPLPCP